MGGALTASPARGVRVSPFDDWNEVRQSASFLRGTADASSWHGVDLRSTGNRRGPLTIPHTRVGVGIIVQREGRVLLGQRLGAHGAGSWALPGGHLEFGESVEACAHRELLEETGLRLSSIRQAPFTVDAFPEDSTHYVTLFVEAHGIEGELENREPLKCGGWAWCDWHALPAPLFRPLSTLQALGYVPSATRPSVTP